MSGCGVETVIPYLKNQRLGEDVLIIDRHFRVFGTEREVRVYGRARSLIEKVNLWLEYLICLDRHKVKGMKYVSVHVALRMITMLLVTVVALRLGIPEKARCIASFK